MIAEAEGIGAAASLLILFLRGDGREITFNSGVNLKCPDPERCCYCVVVFLIHKHIIHLLMHSVNIN